MVKSYGERAEDFKAGLQAAREAIDAAERTHRMYYDAVTRPTSGRAYLREEAGLGAIYHKNNIVAEITEAAQHLADAVASWWEYERIKWPENRPPLMPAPWS